MQGFKVGPDYIDPSYHALASGRPGRNLDAFLSGPELIAPLFRHGAAGADIAVVEGVMGLFDGASGRGELASTAHVAKLLHAPVLLVVDGSAMARSAAAIVHGFATFDPGLRVAGVVLNRVGSDHHEQLLREAIEPLGVPVLGALRRDERVVAPERHLGLVPAGERDARARAALGTLAAAVERHADVAAIEALARAAPALAPGAAWSAARRGRQGRAGADRDRARPGVRVSLRGEPRAARRRRRRAVPSSTRCATRRCRRTAARSSSRAASRRSSAPSSRPTRRCAREIAAFAAAGKPVLAECGGLLYLCRDLDGHEMCGVIAARASMSGRLTLGYRDAVAATATPWIDAGERVRGHEFHYSRIEPVGDERPRGVGAVGPRDDARRRASSPAACRRAGCTSTGPPTRELARRFARARASSPRHDEDVAKCPACRNRRHR